MGRLLRESGTSKDRHRPQHRQYPNRLNNPTGLPRSCSDTFGMEGIILMKLTHLQLGRTLILVESDGILITSSDLETVVAAPSPTYSLSFP